MLEQAPTSDPIGEVLSHADAVLGARRAADPRFRASLEALALSVARVKEPAEAADAFAGGAVALLATDAREQALLQRAFASGPGQGAIAMMFDAQRPLEPAAAPIAEEDEREIAPADVSAHLDGYTPNIMVLLHERLRDLVSWLFDLARAILGPRENRRARLVRSAVAATAEGFGLPLPAVRASRDMGVTRRDAAAAAARLSRPSAKLDIPRTIARTLARGGELSPVRKTRHVEASYLVLSKRLSAHDMEDARVRALVDDLRAHGVVIYYYSYEVDPRVLIDTYGAGGFQRIALDEVRTRHPDARLILATDGRELLNLLTLEPWQWARTLSEWPRRVLATPLPSADWGAVERALHAGLSLAVTSSQEHGLRNLGAITGAAGPTIAERLVSKRPVTPLFVAAPDASLTFETAPSRGERDALIGQLRDYLGSVGFQYLGVCAHFPAMAPPIAGYFGAALQARRGFDKTEMEEAHARIATLPWMRFGAMPYWARRDVVAALDDDARREAREIAASILNDATPSELEEDARTMVTGVGASADTPIVLPIRYGAAGAAGGLEIDELAIEMLAGGDHSIDPELDAQLTALAERAFAAARERRARAARPPIREDIVPTEREESDSNEQDIVAPGTTDGPCRVLVILDRRDVEAWRAVQSFIEEREDAFSFRVFDGDRSALEDAQCVIRVLGVTSVVRRPRESNPIDARALQFIMEDRGGVITLLMPGVDAPDLGEFHPRLRARMRASEVRFRHEDLRGVANEVRDLMAKARHGAPLERPRAYIIHAASTRLEADLLFETLEFLGLQTWTPSRDIAAGERWQEHLQEALSKADVVFALIDKASLNSGYVQYELGFAESRDAWVVPIFLDDSVASMPSALRSRHAIDAREGLTNPRARAWIEIAQIVSELGLPDVPRKLAVLRDRTPPSDSPLVCLYHHNGDSKRVRLVADSLIREGCKIWADDPARMGYSRSEIARHFVPNGGSGNWNERIADAMERADWVVICWSMGLRRHLGSDFAPLAPLLGDGAVTRNVIVCDMDGFKVSDLLSGFHRVDFSQMDERATDHLRDLIRNSSRPDRREGQSAGLSFHDIAVQYRIDANGGAEISERLLVEPRGVLHSWPFEISHDDGASPARSIRDLSVSLAANNTSRDLRVELTARGTLVLHFDPPLRPGQTYQLDIKFVVEGLFGDLFSNLDEQRWSWSARNADPETITTAQFEFAFVGVEGSVSEAGSGDEAGQLVELGFSGEPVSRFRLRDRARGSVLRWERRFVWRPPEFSRPSN